VSVEYQIEFGVALPALPDFSADKCDLISIGADVLTYGLNNQNGIIENHKLCTYFSTLCEQGSDPSMCAERAIGCDGDESP
jgi:hypothetical protein